MSSKREWSVEGAYQYNQRSPLRWIMAHIWRYRLFASVTLIAYIAAWLAYAQARVVIGNAAAEIVTPTGANGLTLLALGVMALLIADGVFMLVGSFAAENIAARFEADARDELYASLLGKSQAFHDRQRVGDIMARATDDTSQLASMIVPGGSMIFEAVLGIIVPLVFTAMINLQLTLVPLAFVLTFIIAVRRYMRRLGPVIADQRAQFGKLNAGLEETISGIEVVKASAREVFEQAKFRGNARRYRDLFVQQGRIEARYLPLLFFGIAFGLTFLHAMVLYSRGAVSVGDIIGAMSLVGLLRFPTFISLFAFSLVQSGYASASRILTIIKSETDLDENAAGVRDPIRGAIEFRNVRFGYDEAAILDDVSFSIQPGQTVAIVGQTGSGKSALTQLVNRTYDASRGQVLIDGI
ncbi:MAG TPA: ABC transporter ATP-binding protein, partial [Herpetosiphonaceae bacterium]|nr:ABC transporter ATP-binding protein [Herpetosiphonaceae bacterium]